MEFFRHWSTERIRTPPCGGVPWGVTRFADRSPVAGASDLYRAEDRQRGGAACALRRVRTTPARAAALRARLREVAPLHHPQLARLVAVGTEDDAVVVAREWLDRPWTAATAEEVCDGLIEVLDGLELAHWHDLVHGDVRVEKLLQADDGRVVLVDLGVAAHGFGGAEQLVGRGPPPAP